MVIFMNPPTLLAQKRIMQYLIGKKVGIYYIGGSLFAHFFTEKINLRTQLKVLSEYLSEGETELSRLFNNTLQIKNNNIRNNN